MQSIPVRFNNILLVLTLLLITITHQEVFCYVPDSLKVDEKVVVDSIKIVGSKKTEEFIILRELNFQIGDTVNQARLHYNRERVFSLGLFNRVEMLVEKTEKLNIIMIDVEETWYIYPIPFWFIEKSELKNSTVGLNLAWKNFRGRNESLNASFGIGYDSYFTLQFDNPALFYDREIGFTFGLGYIKSNNRSDEAELIVGDKFKYKIIKGNIGLYKRINQYNLVGASIGFDNIQLEIIPRNNLTASGTSVDNTPWFSLYYFYDSRDLKQYSRNGLLISTQYYHKGFGVKNIRYNIAELDFRLYQDLVDDLSAKWRAKFRQTFGNVIPFYDYSFLGYSDRVRGHSKTYNEGENSLLSSIELSYPILREWNISLDLPLIPTSLTSARISIYVNAFADAGTTYANADRLFKKRFDSGYGAGLTFLILPFNAVRFEYAINQFGRGEFNIATGFSF